MRSASAGNTAVWVAIIAFALNVGAYGSEIMRSGIDSVDWKSEKNIAKRRAGKDIRYSKDEKNHLTVLF